MISFSKRKMRLYKIGLGNETHFKHEEEY